MEREPESSPEATPMLWALNVYEWLQGHLPKSRSGRLVLAAIFGALVLVLSIGLLLLPIWIGMLEALRIAVEMEDIPADRPLPQHLLGSAITQLGAQVRYVVITRLDRGTYYAHVVLDQQDGTLELDARPSDAIALALAVRAPIYAERRVLEAAGFVPPRPEATTEEN